MPASELITAANDITWLANRFQGLLKAADALKKLGSIENAISEVQARLDGLKKEEDAAKGRVLSIIADAKAEAAKIARHAEEDYEAAMKTAERDAAAVRAEADKAKARHDELTGHIANLEEAIIQRNADHARVLGKIEEAQGEHKRILGLIDALKAKFA